MMFSFPGRDWMAQEHSITLSAAELDGLHEFMRACNDKS